VSWLRGSVRDGSDIRKLLLVLRKWRERSFRVGGPPSVQSGPKPSFVSFDSSGRPYGRPLTSATSFSLFRMSSSGSSTESIELIHFRTPSEARILVNNEILDLYFTPQPDSAGALYLLKVHSLNGARRKRRHHLARPSRKAGRGPRGVCRRQ